MLIYSWNIFDSKQNKYKNSYIKILLETYLLSYNQFKFAL